MKLNLSNQVAIVTGAARGIGRTIAVDLSDAGCRLVLTSRDVETLDETRRMCDHAHTFALPADLTEPGTPERIVERAMQRYGRVDILINNAGAYVRAPMHTAKPEDWESVLDINLRAVMRLTRAALPHIIEAPEGSARAVINMSSVAGKFTFAGGAGYVASKHALMGFSGSAFEDVREMGVKISAICPGFVNTDMVAGQPLDPEKLIQPKDISEAVQFVLGFPSTSCPTEIIIRPQRSPFIRKES